MGCKVREAMQQQGIAKLVERDYGAAYEKMHEIMMAAEREVFLCKVGQQKYGKEVEELAKQRLRDREREMEVCAEMVSRGHAEEDEGRERADGGLVGGREEFRMGDGVRWGRVTVARAAIRVWRELVKVQREEREIHRTYYA